MSDASDASITSPTKILPKRRKEKEIILVNSEISSKSPIKRLKGLKEKKRLRYSLIPSVLILIVCVAAIEIKAKARVALRSVDMLLIRGTKVPCSKNPIVVIIGNNPLQLDIKITRKKVIKYGKIFFVLSAATESVKL